jgi:putative PIN family toxin of toxin-antitoxin system
VRRVVLDSNVYVSALLAPTGSPAQVLERWADGEFDVIVSPLLLGELERVLRRPKFAKSIPAIQIDALLSALPGKKASPSLIQRRSQGQRLIRVMTTLLFSRGQPTPSALCLATRI